MSRSGTYDPKYGFLPDDDCPEPQKPLTNADRIRAMSDEELARWLGDMIFPECPCCPADDRGWCEDCQGRWLSWLKQDAGKEET